MTTFAELFPELPQVDDAWEDRKARLMALTADERIAAMRAGELSYRELTHCSAARPQEVPRVSTGGSTPHCGTISHGGQFESIAMFEPEIAEHHDRDRVALHNAVQRPRPPRELRLVSFFDVPPATPWTAIARTLFLLWLAPAVVAALIVVLAILGGHHRPRWWAVATVAILSFPFFGFLVLAQFAWYVFAGTLLLAAFAWVIAVRRRGFFG